jgi:hypothetical protein
MTPDTPLGYIVVWTVIRNLGVGLALMPIFTSGISALPPALTSSGSSMANVMQRMSTSLAVAVFSSLGLSASAQLMSDRGALLSSGANAIPPVAAATQHGPAGLLGIYRALSNSIQTQTYNNSYYIMGILCVVGIGFALTLRSGKQGGTP